MSKPFIIYHGGCDDGFGAMMAAYIKFGEEAEYYPAYDRNNPPVEARNKDVYIIDYSYSLPSMMELLKNTKSLKLLDHHKSAFLELDGCPGCEFDMSRSGAMMAWNFFHPKFNCIPMYQSYNF